MICNLVWGWKLYFLSLQIAISQIEGDGVGLDIYIERYSHTHTCVYLYTDICRYTHIHMKVYIKRLSKEGLLRALLILRETVRKKMCVQQ